MPVLLIWTDNTASKSWANKVTTSSERGQRLLVIFAELLRTIPLGINSDHIPGPQNVLADFISRPIHFNLSVAERAKQIYRERHWMRTWDYFQLSPYLVSAIRSALSTGPLPEVRDLRKKLGQFVRASSISSNTVEI